MSDEHTWQRDRYTCERHACFKRSFRLSPDILHGREDGEPVREVDRAEFAALDVVYPEWSQVYHRCDEDWEVSDEAL